MRLVTPSAVLALAVCVLSPLAAAEADRAFDALATRYVREFPALSPVSATFLGDHRFDAQLDHVGPEAVAREVEFARRYLADLGRIRRSELSRDRQIDHSLLDHELRRTIWSLERLRAWEWNPLRYTGLAGDAVYSLVARDYAPVGQRLRALAERLEELPRLLAEVRSTLIVERVPRIHAETAVSQNRGVLGVIEPLVLPELDALSAEDRGRLERAIATARRAVDEHQAWLENEVLPKARADFRLGAELFDEKLSYTLNTPLTREDVHRRAREELARVRDEMWEISRGVYAERNPYTVFPEKPDAAYRQAIIRAALEMAYEDRPPRDRIVETAKESLAMCEAFVREKGLVTIPPDPVEIIIMPEFRRGVSLAYCDSPGPLDVGQKTFYAVAPLPESWNDEQVESFLREYNTRSLHDLTIHEAMPGHFLQLAVSNRYPSTLRAVLSSGVFIEGWAVYAEQMMADEGFLGGDPLQKLIARKWYLRGIANALLDQGVHVHGWSRDEAMRLMIEDTFQEEREAAAKWVRAQLTSAQLSTYFVGYQQHRDLRAEVEARQGDSFRLGAYHDRVLSFGSPPVQYVRALLLDLPIPGESSERGEAR